MQDKTCVLSTRRRISVIKPAFSCLLTGLTVFAASQASAIIVHPADDPPNGLSTPPADVLGRWASNASAVAIDPNYIITTRHQGSGVGANVTFGGTTYVAAEIFNLSGSVDARVVRIEALGGGAANLSDFVSIYEGSSEVSSTLVIGGFGDGRGANLDLSPPPGTDAYQWDGVRGTQRWGANEITATGDDVNVFGSWVNDTLEAVFEAPGNGVSVEATIADGDSGGGWFIDAGGGNWQVAALSQAVEFSEEARFGETLFGVRLTNYAGEINAIIPEPSSLALLLAGGALLARRRR